MLVSRPQMDTLIWAFATVIFIIVGSWLVAKLASWVAGRFRLSEAEQRKVFWGFLFASPWLIGFFIFVVGPSLASLIYSLTNYKLGTEAEWVGIENFRDLIQAVGRDGRNFRSAMYNSLYYAMVGVPLQIFAALGMAILLNTALRGVKVFRLIYYLPVVLAGGPAILLAWRYMLASNGGFVNEMLNGISNALPFLNYIYRGVVFVIEKFNGFFIGIAKGDPTGPFNFFLPALIGTLVFLVLWRGEWGSGKQLFARRVIELIVGIIGSLLLVVGLVAEPVDMSIAFVLSLLAVVLVLLNVSVGQFGRARLIQVVALISIVAAFILTLIAPAEADFADAKNGYLLAIGLCLLPVLATFAPGGWDKRKYMIVGAASAVIVGIILVRVIPTNWDAGKGDVFIRYLTLQTAIEQPDNMDYLREGYNARYLDSVWLFGIVALSALVAIMIRQRPQAQKIFLSVTLIAFALIAVSSFIDGVRYFQAYVDVSAASGTNVFHFARFREAGQVWDMTIPYNPKWMSSDLWAKPALILINMWSAGAGMLIFLAALKGVPIQLYEAAKVDGANRFERFFKITLPLISPALFYNIIIGMIAALQTFESVYILRTTDTETSIMSAAFYLYRRTFEQANIGEGSAMSWILAVVIVGLTVIQFRYSNWVNYEA